MSRVIIVIGTGRSGTSWIHDVMSAHHNYRRIFEPLHPDQVASMSEFSGLYLDETDNNPRLKEYLDCVFHHRTNDAWISWLHMGISKHTPLLRKMIQHVSNLHQVKVFAANRVVKFIQANMMISWLVENFRYQIVFVIRNPYSTIQSQLHMGWSHDLAPYLVQNKLRGKVLSEPLIRYVESLQSVTERLAARWCIENIVAIKDIQRLDGAVIPVTYEYLSNFENLLLLLTKLNYSQKEISIIKKRILIRERLRSSKRKSTSGASITPQQRKNIQDVLCMFGIVSYENLTRDFNKLELKSLI